VDEKKGFYTSLCKKAIASGVNDKKEGVVALLNRSSRARSIFTSKVSTLRIRPEVTGKFAPALQDGGIIVIPMLIGDVDSLLPWGTLIDSCLGLRVDDEEAMRKAEAAVEKTAKVGTFLPMRCFSHLAALNRAPSRLCWIGLRSWRSPRWCARRQTSDWCPSRTSWMWCRRVWVSDRA
jgi:hypothetical protein